MHVHPLPAPSKAGQHAERQVTELRYGDTGPAPLSLGGRGQDRAQLGADSTGGVTADRSDPVPVVLIGDLGAEQALLGVQRQLAQCQEEPDETKPV